MGSESLRGLEAEPGLSLNFNRTRNTAENQQHQSRPAQSEVPDRRPPLGLGLPVETSPKAFSKAPAPPLALSSSWSHGGLRPVRGRAEGGVHPALGGRGYLGPRIHLPQHARNDDERFPPELRKHLYHHHRKLRTAARWRWAALSPTVAGQLPARFESQRFLWASLGSGLGGPLPLRMGRIPEQCLRKSEGVHEIFLCVFPLCGDYMLWFTRLHPVQQLQSQAGCFPQVVTIAADWDGSYNGEEFLRLQAAFG